MKLNKLLITSLTIILTLGLFSCVKKAPIDNTTVIDLDNSSGYKALSIRIINPGNHQKNKESEFTSEASSENGNLTNREWKVFKGTPESSDPNAKINYSKDYVKLSASSTSGIFKHTFADTGAYRISLKVTDVKGEYRTVYEDIKVGENSEASDQASQVLVYISHDGKHNVDKKSVFKSHKSKTLSGGSISTYKWVLYDDTDRNNPQQLTDDQNTDSNDFNYTFTKKGAYKLSLTLTDTNGERNTANLYFDVEKNKDNSPEIDSKITNLSIGVSANPRAGNTTPVTFTANTTLASGNNISEYEWTIYDENGDIKKQTSTGTNNLLENEIFDTAGLYRVKVKASLDANNYKSVVKNVDIGKSDENSDDAGILNLKITKPSQIKVGNNIFEYVASLTSGSKTIDNSSSAWKLAKKDSNDVYQNIQNGSGNQFTMALTKADFGSSYRLGVKVQTTDAQTYKTVYEYFNFTDTFPPEIVEADSHIKDATQAQQPSKTIIKRGYSIYIKLNEVINPDTLIGANIKLVRADSDKTVATNIIKPSGTKQDYFSVFINEALESDINYRLIIKNLADLSGNKTDIARIYTTANLDATSGVWYVKPTGDDNNNGASWDNAFKSVQKAVTTASNGQIVFVAKGTYKASSGQLLRLKTGVKIYGGFPDNLTGYDRNASFSARDVIANKTILSAQKSGASLVNVVIADNVQNSLLDGFTLQDVNSNNSNASALRVVNSSSISINNCIFTNNISTDANSAKGAAIMNEYSRVKVTNSLFSANESKNQGGALYNGDNASFEVINTKFNNNKSVKGGAIYDAGKNLEVVDSSFFKNIAEKVGSASEGSGGAIYLDSRADATIINSSFNANKAKVHGDGIYNGIATNEVLNSTFANHPKSAYHSELEGFNESISIQNTIFWNNGTDVERSGSTKIDAYANISLDNSMVKKSNLGDSLIIPGYIKPDATKVPIGTWNSQGGYFPLTIDSPAINSGKDSLFTRMPKRDQIGNPRIVGAAIDLGAVESQ